MAKPDNEPKTALIAINLNTIVTVIATAVAGWLIGTMKDKNALINDVPALKVAVAELKTNSVTRVEFQITRSEIQSNLEKINERISGQSLRSPRQGGERNLPMDKP